MKEMGGCAVPASLTGSTVEALQTLLENRRRTTLNVGHTRHGGTWHGGCML